MAGQTPAVPCSFHADQLVLAEPGRALVRAIDRETPAPRRPQVGQAARKGHPRLGGHMERRPQTIHLDKICGRNPRITRATFAADQRSRTLVASYKTAKDHAQRLDQKHADDGSSSNSNPSSSVWHLIDVISGEIE